MTSATKQALYALLRQYNQGVITSQSELYHRIAELYYQQNPNHH